MKRRKQYIVDKKFQINTALRITGYVTIISAIILITIAVNLIFNDNKIHNIIKSEDGIFQTLSVITTNETKKPEYKAAFGDMSKDHINNFKITDGIINYNRILIISLIVFILLQGIVLYIIMIRRTNRISGPIYVMSNYFKEIIDGKIPNPRALRKKDELTEFYQLFIKMVDSMREQKKKKK
jgi:hypothetical protein